MPGGSSLGSFMHMNAAGSLDAVGSESQDALNELNNLLDNSNGGYGAGELQNGDGDEPCF